MSGGELAVVLASVAVVVAVGVLGAIGVSLSRALRDLRRLLSEIRRDLLPAVQRIEEASGQVTGEVQRVGGLLDVAERVSERAETLSRVTYRALVEPFGAVASLFRRGPAREPDPPAAAEPVPAGRGAVAHAGSRPERGRSWPRRLTAHLLRAGYRSAAARIAARLAAAQAQRSATAAPRATDGATAPPRPVAADTAGSGSAGSPWGRQLLDAVREVTEEISSALEEGRRTLQAERRGEGRPE